jgi:CHAT domain-containing protein
MAGKRHLLLNGLQTVLNHYVWYRIFYTALFIISLLICLLGHGMTQPAQAKSTQCDTAEIDKFQGKNGHRERELLEACKESKDLPPQERAKVLRRLAIVSYDSIGSLAYDQLGRGDRKGKIAHIESLLKESIDIGEKLRDRSIVNDAQYAWAQISVSEVERINFHGVEAKDAITLYQQMNSAIDLLHRTASNFDQLSPVYRLQPQLAEVRLLINNLPEFYNILTIKITQLENDRLGKIKLQKKQTQLLKTPSLQAITSGEVKPLVLLELENITRIVTKKLLDSLQNIDLEFSGLEPSQSAISAHIYHAASLKRLKLLTKSMADFETERQRIFDIRQNEFKQKTSIKPISFKQQSNQANEPTQPMTYISFWPQELRETAQKYHVSSHKKAQDLLARSINMARTIQDARNPALTDKERATVKREELQAINALAALYEENGQFEVAASLIPETVLLEADALGSPEISGLLYGRVARSKLKQIKENKIKGNQITTEDVQAALALSEISIERIKLVRGDLLSLSPDLQYSYRDSIEPLYRDNIELQLLQAKPNLKTILERVESLKLAEIHNYFREPCIETKVSLDEFINQDFQDTVLIYTILLDESMEIIAKLPNRVKPDPKEAKEELRHYRTMEKQSEIEKASVEWKNEILNDSTSSKSQQLYDWIFLAQEVGPDQKLTDRTLESELIPLKRVPGQTTLIMVLDGVLRTVPIAALRNGESYLIDDFAIAVSPGLQLFEPKKIGKPKILFTGQKEFAALNLKPLPGSEVELKNLQKRIPPQGILSDAAGQKYKSLTLSSFGELVSKEPFNVVHLATHAEFSSDQEKTFIAMGSQKVSTEAFAEILSRRDRTRTEAIDLLILSACETATGDNRAALGLSGLAIRSGARSTLASLWPILDEEDITPKLLDDFYQNLFKHGKNKAQALREAQLSLKRDKLISRWAPYVIVGNWL